MKKLSILLTFITLLLPLSAQEMKRVLFVGNSYTEVNDLPLLVQQVAQSAGNRLEYQSNTPGGCTFSQHCANESMSLICQGGWDVVVLQEQSQLPSFPQSQAEEECFPYAAQLVDSVYAHNPDGEAMFYMTWGRKYGDQYNAQYFPVLGTYEGMDSMLYERYLYMARANDASVCPVGRVWRYLRNNHPEIELYQTDDSHPSLAGSYAAACSFYTMIYHDSPLNITYTADLADDVARNIRNAVQTVVYDTLSFWLRQSTDTTQTDTTSTDTSSTDTIQMGVTNITAENFMCNVYPNPSHGVLTISLPSNCTDAEAFIYDFQGRCRDTIHLSKGNNRFLLKNCASGIYLIKVVSPEGSVNKKIIIK